MLGKIEGRREGIGRGWDDWMASSTQWTWVWVDPRSWWWTGRPGVVQFMGLQRVGHDWATELSWTDHPFPCNTHTLPTFLWGDFPTKSHLHSPWLFQVHRLLNMRPFLSGTPGTTEANLCSSLVDVHVLGAFYQLRWFPIQQELKAEWSRLWKMKTTLGWATHHLREALGNTLNLEKQGKPSLRWTWGWDAFQVEVSDLIDLESVFTAKETINKMKRQPTEREKIIVNEATNKELISKIYK